MSLSREEGSMTSPVIHVPLCPDHAFLVGCSGSCTLCPCSAISGHHDGDLVSLTRRVYRKFKRYFANDHCCWRTSFPLRWNSCLTRPRSRRRPLSATQPHPTTSLVGISWYCN